MTIKTFEDLKSSNIVPISKKMEWSATIMDKMTACPRAFRESPLKEWWLEQQKLKESKK